MVEFCPFMKDFQLSNLLDRYITLYEEMELEDQRCNAILSTAKTELMGIYTQYEFYQTTIARSEANVRFLEEEIEKRTLLEEDTSDLEDVLFEAYRNLELVKSDGENNSEYTRLNMAFMFSSYASSLMELLNANPGCFDEHMTDAVLNSVVGVAGMVMLSGATPMASLVTMQASQLMLSVLDFIKTGTRKTRKARSRLVATKNFNGLMCSYMNLQKYRCDERERQEFNLKKVRQNLYKEIESLDTEDKQFSFSQFSNVILSSKQGLLVALQQIAANRERWQRLTPNPYVLLQITPDLELDEPSNGLPADIKWGIEEEAQTKFVTWSAQFQYAAINDINFQQDILIPFCRLTLLPPFNASIYDANRSSCRFNRYPESNSRASLWTMRQIIIQIQILEKEIQEQLEQNKSFDDREFTLNEALEFYLEKLVYFNALVPANSFRSDKITNIVQALLDFAKIPSDSSIEFIEAEGNRTYKLIAAIIDPSNGNIINESLVKSLFSLYLEEISTYYSFNEKKELRKKFRKYALKRQIEDRLWKETEEGGGEGVGDLAVLGEIINSFDLVFNMSVNRHLSSLIKSSWVSLEEKSSFLNHACLIFRDMNSKFIPKTCAAFIPQQLELITHDPTTKIPVKADTCWYVKDYQEQALDLKMSNILERIETRPYH
jgi:hypothetical protein